MEMTNCISNPDISKETFVLDNMPTPSVITPEIRAFLAPSQYGVFSIITLLCIALSPLFTMVIFILLCHNIFLSMLVMHWVCMFLLPLLFLFSNPYSNTLYYTYFWNINKHRFKKQLLWSTLGLLSMTILMVSAYYLFFYILGVYTPEFLNSYIAFIKSSAAQNGMQKSFSVILSLGIYFVLWNPVIEEFFWRIFLYKEVGGLLYRSEDLYYRVEKGQLRRNHDIEQGIENYMKNSAENNDTLTENTAIEVTSNSYGGCSNNNTIDQNSNHSVYVDIDIGIFGNILISLFYMSYHSIVFYQLAGILSIIPCIIALTVLGYIFIYVRNSTKFGILTAIGIHLGVDLGVILIYGNIIGLI